ncbi:hypothetical protein ILUMI_07650, partial [Ignelater luminosus]
MAAACILVEIDEAVKVNGVEELDKAPEVWARRDGGRRDARGAVAADLGVKRAIVAPCRGLVPWWCSWDEGRGMGLENRVLGDRASGGGGGSQRLPEDCGISTERHTAAMKVVRNNEREGGSNEVRSRLKE